MPPHSQYMTSLFGASQELEAIADAFWRMACCAIISTALDVDLMALFKRANVVLFGHSLTHRRVYINIANAAKVNVQVPGFCSFGFVLGELFVDSTLQALHHKIAFLFGFPRRRPGTCPIQATPAPIHPACVPTGCWVGCSPGRCSSIHLRLEWWRCCGARVGDEAQESDWH